MSLQLRASKARNEFIQLNDGEEMKIAPQQSYVIHSFYTQACIKDCNCATRFETSTFSTKKICWLKKWLRGEFIDEFASLMMRRIVAVFRLIGFEDELTMNERSRQRL